MANQTYNVIPSYDLNQYFQFPAGNYPGQNFGTNIWPVIRDGIVYIRKTDDTISSVSYSWTDVGTANAATNWVAVQAPDGNLISLDKLTETAGSRTIQLAHGIGDYQVHFAGAAVRNYVLTVTSYASVIEPVKVHQAMTWNAQPNTAYFRVPANTAFTFGAKRYSSSAVANYTLTDMATMVQTPINLTVQPLYSQFELFPFPATMEDRVFRVQNTTGTGRVAIWLDGIDNLFSLQQNQIFTPVYKPAQTAILCGSPVGPMPGLGATLPYQDLTTGETAFVEWLFANSANPATNSTSTYFFRGNLERNPNHDVPFLTRNEQAFGLNYFNTTIMADPTVIIDVPATINFLKTYLPARHGANLLLTTGIAIADEGNLNYSNPDTVTEQFATISASIKGDPNPLIFSTKMSFPQSSQMWDGPTTADSSLRKGADQLEDILRSGQRHLIDYITFHLWGYRKLVLSGVYYDQVIKTYELQSKYKQQSDTDLPIVISQTNMMSGDSTSSYEEDTFYASLWFTGNFCEGARTGKLSSYIWFPMINDDHHFKGLCQMTTGDAKIVAYAVKFALDHKGLTALETGSSHFEVSAVSSTTQGNKLRLLGVNKGRRVQNISVVFPRALTQATVYRLNGTAVTSEVINISGNTVQLIIAPETIFSIDEV